jgi:hypothetical protein|tara:strand:- start:35 stop:541 length:507 start_codon:yes stop_codon:yes gene_type:complete
MSKTYKIPQAKHSSGFHFGPHIQKTFLQHSVMFDKTAMYYHGDIDQYDINKLFGISYGLHHTNSVRFGWRSVGHYSSKIEILAYCYVDGKRVIEDSDNLFIAIVDIGKFYTYRINVCDNDFTLTIFHNDQVVGRKEIQHRGIPSWGYKLYPYFGGNRKAPHDINIYFK